jgi:hypothetical protein
MGRAVSHLSISVSLAVYVCLNSGPSTARERILLLALTFIVRIEVTVAVMFV